MTTLKQDPSINIKYITTKLFNSEDERCYWNPWKVIVCSSAFFCECLKTINYCFGVRIDFLGMPMTSPLKIIVTNITLLRKMMKTIGLE